ncbi:MAG: hydroxymethylbilane synthase [Alphaproteobacteria bacterium]|nr:hydroxymethylbilane synthase [Alphaproteobacteria bacterium]
MSEYRTPVKLGTRGSKLALAQAYAVRDTLQAAVPELREEGAVEIVIVSTTGDQILDKPLTEIGGKGLFVKEIEEALYDGRIDAAVHSMKDVPTFLPDGLTLTAVMEREDPRDAFVSSKYTRLGAMPRGAVLGTSSVRRAALIKAQRPDLEIVQFRGNVQTRLKKLEDGVADATLLAMAGLRRLGMEHVATQPLAPEEMLPAVAQGAVGIEIREADTGLAELFQHINHGETWRRVIAERAMLAVLDGSCKTPICAYAEIDGAGMRVRGQVVALDGSQSWSDEEAGPVADAEALGARVGERLRSAAGEDFFAALAD